MIRVYCVRGNADKEMGEVSDQLLSSTDAAVKRGTYEINKQWYLVHSQSITAPLKKTTDSTAIMDGDIVEVSDSLLGIYGKRKISRLTLSGNKSDVSLSLTLEKFEDFI